MKSEQNNTSMQRRGFLKKAVYAAPAVMLLGSLRTPASACSSSFGGGHTGFHPGGPGDGFHGGPHDGHHGGGPHGGHGRPW